MKDGKGKIEFTVTKEYYEGEFKEDCKHGKGIYKFKDGSSFNGEWYYDKYWGEGVFEEENGKVYKGKFYDSEFI